MALTKQDRRQRIRNRIRKIVSGTADSPRLSVYRSNKEIYAQLIDDVSGKTLCACSSREKEITTEGGLNLNHKKKFLKILIKKLELYF